MWRRNMPTLLDVVTRHQIYLEGVKSYYSKNFDAVIRELRRELLIIFADNEYDDLSMMSKSKLNEFIKVVITTLQHQYDPYLQQVLDDLRAFMDADAQMNLDIMEKTQDDDSAFAAASLLLTADGLDRMWATIVNAPIPANGMTPTEFVQRFVDSNSSQVELALKKAWSNKMTMKQALGLIFGTARLNNRDGLIYKAAFQNNAMIATLVQHASSIASAQVASRYFDEYRWVSVLDGHTTVICRDRNGKIYRYGDGPLPPAHVGCRSKTEPYYGQTDDVDLSYYEWMTEQPDKVQNDILGNARATSLRNGELTESDLPKFDEVTPLTLTQFMGKLNLILAV